MFKNFYKSCRFWGNVEKCGGAREATNCNAIWRVRVACCINKATRALTHTHTHTEICNTCCFSAVTMVSRMRVIVTLHVHCVSRYLRYCTTSPGRIVNKCKVWKSFCFMITCCLFICLVVSRLFYLLYNLQNIEKRRIFLYWIVLGWGKACVKVRPVVGPLSIRRLMECLNRKHWWTGNDRRMPKYSEKSLSQCHFVYHKSHFDCP
jgi:hypothetical protein